MSYIKNYSVKGGQQAVINQNWTLNVWNDWGCLTEKALNNENNLIQKC